MSVIGLQGCRVTRLQGYKVAGLWLKVGQQWKKRLFLRGFARVSTLLKIIF